MKQGLQLKFSQNLSLTPQLQQAIKLLQLSTLDLNQEIDALMQTNPLLERGDANEDEYGNPVDDRRDEKPELEAIDPDKLYEASLDELNNIDGKTVDEAPLTSLTTDAIDTPTSAEVDAVADIPLPDKNSVEVAPSAESGDLEAIAKTGEFETEFSDEYGEFSNGSRWEESSRPADDDSDFRPQEALPLSLRDHLVDQIKLLPLSERDQTLLLLIVDAINEDGYLAEDLASIAEQLPEEFEIDELELQTALRHIQHLDPIGVGARDLGECILLQLAAMNSMTPHISLAKTIATEHLPLLAARDFNKIKKALNCDDDALKSAQKLITSLNPRPGSDYANIGSEHYIQHEVIVKKVKGIWIATLNDGVIPKLKINQMYAGILKRNKDSNSQYLQSQMQEAKWMIKNIQQRFATILRVSQAIVDRQRNFLEYGEVAMKPLVLREIADEVGLHESTISRVTTHKYMLTPRGIFELKYFFGSSVATEAGGTCSATAIRALIKKMIEDENPQKPYSDNKITELLSKQGIKVARRTIAKYREALNIPPANLRKTL